MAQGWFRSGDLAVWHPDGYVGDQDRSKDIIISGGENISSLEVEDVLYRHPDVEEAAVIAMPDETWGGALRLRQSSRRARAHPGRAHCVLPRADGPLQGPKHIIFTPLPKTSTGKVQNSCCAKQLA